jgi:ABC-2 type transport system permease protein
MIMTATSAPVPSQAGFTVSTVLIAKRATLTFLRTPQLIVLSLVQMTVIMLTFRYVFGGALGTVQGLPYVDFAVPGFIAAGVLFQTLSTAIAMAEDLQGGFIDRLRSMPFPSAAVLAGRVLADIGNLALVLAITTVVGFAIGFRLHGSALEGLAAFGLCLVFGLAFSWVFIALGLLTRNAKAAQSLSMLVFLMVFPSSAYISVGTMPWWLRGFARNQPMTAMADAVRALTLGSHAPALLGHGAGYYLIRSLLWAAAITIVFSALAIARFRRG